MNDLDGLLSELRTAEDPYPVYAAIRALGRVVWIESLDRWLITGHAQAQALFSHGSASANRDLARDAAPSNGSGYRPRGLPFVDPPDHTRLRSLVRPAFSARAVQRLRPTVRRLAGDLLADARERGRIDLIADLAGPLPALVLAELLGIPAADQQAFRRWAATVIETIDPVSMRLVSGHGDDARRELLGYLTQLIAERRRRPADDLISGLIRAGESGAGLSPDELLDMCFLLIVVGIETTTNLIGNGVNALLDHPGELAGLRAEPGRIRVAVEELLRYDAPVQLAGRIARQDIELDGVTLREGQTAGLVLGAANRDPEAFASPDRLDLTRTPNNHLGFGRGIHFCLGAPLAMLQAPIVIGTLVSRFTRLCRTGPPTRRRNVHVRGFDTLPVGLG